MDCSTFSQYLDEYGELWHRGLKKQANSVMKELVDRLEKLPTDEERDALIIPLCQEKAPSGIMVDCPTVLSNS